jgi:hypothetical protein
VHRRGGVVLASALSLCAAPCALATITASPAQQSQAVSSATLAPPTGVTVARGGVGTCVPAVSFEIDLSWVASSLATGYAIRRSTTNGGPYTTVGTTTTATTYKDLGPVAGFTWGTTYYYIVAATRGSWSTNSSQGSIATPSQLTCL